MLRHRIAHVALEPVARMRGAQAAHQAVARDLGNDRGRGDREHQRVAADHRAALAIDIDAVDAVDEHEPGQYGKRLDGARQRPERRAADIVGLDARRRRDRDRDLGGRADFLVKDRARLGVQLLGIVQAPGDAPGIENDRRGNHRTGQRPPARLVAARDRENALLHRVTLAIEGGADDLVTQRKACGGGATHGGDPARIAARVQFARCAAVKVGDREPGGRPAVLLGRTHAGSRFSLRILWQKLGHALLELRPS